MINSQQWKEKVRTLDLLKIFIHVNLTVIKGMNLHIYVIGIYLLC